MSNQAVVASFPALSAPGWGFHAVDDVDYLATPRARAQIRALSYFALRSGPDRDGKKYPDGHVITGVERKGSDIEIFVFFVPAPAGIAVLTTTTPTGLMNFRMPRDGFRIDDLRMKAREFGCVAQVNDAADIYHAASPS